MKRLIIMRHGEAQEPGGTLGDRERSLTERGVADAKHTASLLLESSWIPEAVLYSGAARTEETFTCVRDTMALACSQTTMVPRFYLGGLADIFNAMATVDDSLSTVLMIGHNPGWSESVSILSGQYLSLRPGQASLLEIDDDSWLEALGRKSQWRLIDTLGT